MIWSSLLLPAALLAQAGAETCPAAAAVNGFIGTGGLGYGYGGVNPAALVPGGPMRLGPDSTNTMANVGYRHFSGYNYLDDQIRMFSHTHLVGAGMNDLGNFGVMPVRIFDRHETENENETDTMLHWLQLGQARDKVDQHTRVWWSMFNKSTEWAAPGRYGVYLETPRVQAALLATGRSTAVHRYTFEADAADATADAGAGVSDGDRGRDGRGRGRGMIAPGVVLDVCHLAHIEAGVIRDQRCEVASLEISADLTSFSASVWDSGRLWVHLYGQFGFGGLPPARWVTCSNAAGGLGSLDCSSETRSAATEHGMLFSRVSFGPAPAARPAAVELRVALSFISTEQAKKNFNAIDNTLPYGSLVAATERLWCDTLGFFSVEPLPGDADMAAMLYSASYRARMAPADYTEAGGVYMGLDQQVHDVAAERAGMYPDSLAASEKTMQFYSDFSFWDTFRTLHPWLLLTDESLAVGILRSVSEMTQQQQGYPKWVLANVDTGGMLGCHGAALALEGALAGLGAEFDVSGIQKMLVNQFTQVWSPNGRNDVDFYMANGYVSAEAGDVSASDTLSYAYDDSILAGLSAFVGDTASAEAALERSKNYRNLWSEEKEFMCPRSNTGELQCPRNATSPEAWTLYKEGDGLHWSTFVMHDVPGLQALYASPRDFRDRLEAFFADRMEVFNAWGNAVPNPYFWVGNEVDQFALWMFNFDSDCTRTQYWARNTTRTHYSNTPHGVPGNEDYGAMSSWLLFTSLGIYPQAGTTNYLIGSPGVRSASLRLAHLDGSASTLQIRAENNSAENVYVKSLRVNGQPYYSTMLDRAVLAAPGGCRLDFVMSAVPASDLCREHTQAA
jgi:predicted alpha-1,2-mannosidase